MQYVLKLQHNQDEVIHLGPFDTVSAAQDAASQFFNWRCSALHWTMRIYFEIEKLHTLQELTDQE